VTGSWRKTVIMGGREREEAEKEMTKRREKKCKKV
jgi:hypothetical protein